MNFKKKIRNLKANGKFGSHQYQKFIQLMTNWQNSQWLRNGAIPAKAEEYSQLKRK